MSAIPTIYTTFISAPALNPESVDAGAPATTLIIYGQNFAPGAVVLSNGYILTPSKNSGAHITVTLSASLLVEPGAYAVTVEIRLRAARPTASTSRLIS